jgi:hypothetical protein
MQVACVLHATHVYFTAWEYCFFYVHLVKAFGDADRFMDVRHMSHVFLIYNKVWDYVDFNDR